MMKEIVYSETRPGLYEPAPTRAEIRRQKRAEKKRAEERSDFWLHWGGVFILGLVILGYAAIFAVDIFASSIWPAR